MEKMVAIEEYARTRSRKAGAWKKAGLLALFLAPFLLAFIVFFVFPLFYGIYISLTNFTYGAPGSETFNNFEWYKFILTKPADELSEHAGIYHNFWASFANSFVFSVIMVPIAIILPLFLAILVNTKPPFYKAFRTIIYLPSIVPLTASGCIFMALFLDDAANGILYELFKIDTLWFLDIWFQFDFLGTVVKVPYAWIPVFLMCLWGGWGSNFIILNAGLQNVPKNLYEASSIDGCSKWNQIKNVTIPGIKGQLVLCLFTTIIGYLGLYGQNYVLTLKGPFEQFGTASIYKAFPGSGMTSTVMYFIQDIVANDPDFKSTYYGLGAAASIVFAVCVGIISGIQQFATRDRKTGFKISEAYNKWLKIRSQ